MKIEVPEFIKIQVTNILLKLSNHQGYVSLTGSICKYITNTKT